MDNNARIQKNNAELRNAIDLAENLPDAGGGGESVEPVIESIAIVENGTYTAPDGVNGYSPIEVNVPIPEGYLIPNGTLEVTENGTHDVADKALVNVNVPTGGGGTDARFKALAEGILTEIDDDTITKTRSYAFYAAGSLTRVNLPNVTSVGSYTFNACESLVTADLPKLSGAVATYTFTSCSALTRVNIPKATGANNYSFQDCSSLEKVELGVATTVGSYAFRRAGVTALIIRNNTSKLSKLSSTNAFTDCPIANGEGYIYFPREYAESYKSATGWSAYADQIRAIEDYPEITGG